MTTVLRAETSADFLAMVPALAGYQASDSLVCVMFVGKRTRGALRLDLPAEHDDARLRSIATTLIGLLGQARGVDRVVPVVYTSETFAGQEGVPWSDLLDVVQRRLDDAGFGIPDALCVAADGWASLFDDDAPVTGRPLDEIAASPLAQHRELAPRRHLGELSELPQASRETVRELRRALAQISRCTTTSELAAVLDADADDVAPAEWLERCLRHDERLTAAQGAWLLELVQSPGVRDAAMLQIAFGKEYGEEVLAANDYYAAVQRRTGQAMDEIVLEEMEDGHLPTGHDHGAAIAGDREDRPDVDRVERGIRVLRDLIVHAPQALQPAPLCILAWLNWALGLSSVAGRHIDAALAIDPGYGMAQVLWTLFGSGKLPRWAFAAIPQES